MRTKILTFTLSLMLVVSTPAFSSGHSSPESPGFFAMAGDLLIARPLLLVTTVVGGAVFVVSSPFSALGGNIDDAANVLVKTPAKATFKRCLGCPFSENE